MKKYGVIALISLTMLLNWKCVKHVFGKIEVKGSIKDWWTNEPIESKIEVFALPGNSGFVKSQIVSVATFFNKSDGSFAQTMKSYKSNKYRIDFIKFKADSVSGFQVQFSKDISLRKKGVMDFGEMIDMPHLFTCRINIKHVSNSKDVLSFDANPSVKIQNDTILYKTFSFTKEFYEFSGHKFSFAYSIENNTSGSLQTVPGVLIFEIDKSDYLEGNIYF